MKVKNNLFNEGAVTLSFDDGWKSIYNNAFPILQKAGLKSTHYIISGCLDESQFPRYMNENNIKNLLKAGHEIGCHTASHKRLTEETDSIIREEILLSKKYLEKIIGSVKTFAYPYGDYNREIVKVVREAGFIGARSISDGFNDKTSDPFLLKCKAIQVETRFPEARKWIDYAKDKNKWLILMLHQVDYEGRKWSTTPEKLKEITDYLSGIKIPVITIREGLKRYYVS